MKYTFKIPELADVNTDKKLIISHSIFLDAEQRKKSYVETIGVSDPVWTDATEPSKEIFCRYQIFTGCSFTAIIIDENGYQIYLKKLSEWLNFNLSSIIKVNDINYQVIHQVVIS